MDTMSFDGLDFLGDKSIDEVKNEQIELPPEGVYTIVCTEGTSTLEKSRQNVDYRVMKPRFEIAEGEFAGTKLKPCFWIWWHGSGPQSSRIGRVALASFISACGHKHQPKSLDVCFGVKVKARIVHEEYVDRHDNKRTSLVVVGDSFEAVGNSVPSHENAAGASAPANDQNDNVPDFLRQQ